METPQELYGRSLKVQLALNAQKGPKQGFLSLKVVSVPTDLMDPKIAHTVKVESAPETLGICQNDLTEERYCARNPGNTGNYPNWEAIFSAKTSQVDQASHRQIIK